MKSKSRRYEVLRQVRFNDGTDDETLFRDDLALVVVDVPDTAKNRKKDESVQSALETATRTTGNLDGELSGRY